MGNFFRVRKLATAKYEASSPEALEIKSEAEGNPVGAHAYKILLTTPKIYVKWKYVFQINRAAKR